MEPISVLLCGLSIYIVFLENCGDFQTMILWRFLNCDFMTETQMVLNSILIKYMLEPQWWSWWLDISCLIYPFGYGFSEVWLFDHLFTYTLKFLYYGIVQVENYSIANPIYIIWGLVIEMLNFI